MEYISILMFIWGVYECFGLCTANILVYRLLVHLMFVKKTFTMNF